MLIRLCLSLLQSYDTKEPKTKFLSLEFFRGMGYNSLIINIMTNPFLRIFHLADYQAVTSATKYKRGNPRKILMFCILQVLTKDYGHEHRKYWLISQNTHICLVYSRNTYIVTHAIILSTAKDLLDDNQTMTETKNGDLKSSHLW